MPDYLLFLYEDPAVFERVSPEEMQAIIEKYTSWKQRMLQSGVLQGGEKLKPGSGKILRRAAGRSSVTDGPFTESKEVIGGFFHISARDYEQAVLAAQDCPHLEYGMIEVREVDQIPSAPGKES